VKQSIERIIRNTIDQSNLTTTYRTPLLGVASASDPRFAQLKEIVDPAHLLPTDLLPEARSVVAFFLPFSRALGEINRCHPYVAREWAVAYVEANQLIRDICANVKGHLEVGGIRTAYEQPTHNFDVEKLVSFWSHKHVAWICGLGQFGLHHMLITRRGCLGRLGSLVLDATIEEPDAPAPEFCLIRQGKSCRHCVRSCPTGALTVSGLDRQRCYERLLEVNDHYGAIGLCDVCGKCATGPCTVMD
jgi:epoxyqueuosine reductase QueG